MTGHDDEVFEGEIFQRGGLSLAGSIRRAALCNPQEERWTDVERADDETRDAFMARVRAARVLHGGHIVWNPMPDPGW
jgi:hypothetical protein